MGGLGSSRWHLHTAKTTTSEVHSITISDLAPHIKAINSREQAEVIRKFTWRSALGNVTGSALAIVARDADDRLVAGFGYTCRVGSVECCVNITTMPCNLGGKRFYFVCHCGRRITRLYLLYPRVICRHCGDIQYQTSRDSRRSLSRWNYLLNKLYE